jgi:hypothetical protein
LLPLFACGAREGAPQRFSIWLAGLPDCPNGFEMVDCLDPAAAGSVLATLVFSTSDLQQRETPYRPCGLQSMTTALGEVARKPSTSTGTLPQPASFDYRTAGSILLRE